MSRRGTSEAGEKQVDLFLDSLINAPFKDDRALMEFPFFSLQKTPRTKPMVYDDGRVRVEIRPGDRGIATIWDKDVLIYLASIINDRIERGLPVERIVRFNAHNLLKVTGRGSGKRAYELLLDAIYRLRSTTIVTTIEAGETRERRGFGWIETFRILERRTTGGKKVMAGCEIGLNDWMFRAIVQDRRVLTINPA
jgi:plasmid replication initiation protein